MKGNGYNFAKMNVVMIGSNLYSITEMMVQFQQLWDYLVPASGKAQTAQGEMIRIAGKVRHEFMDNGGMNWANDFRKMLKAFVLYARLGEPLPNNAKAAKISPSILLNRRRQI